MIEWKVRERGKDEQGYERKNTWRECEGGDKKMKRERQVKRGERDGEQER